MKNIALLSCLLASQAAHASPNECLQNFSATQNEALATTYKTQGSFRFVKTDDAFKRVHTFLANNGMSILSIDKENGVISALNEGNDRSGAFNAVIKKGSYGGSIVNLSFNLPAGVLTSNQATQSYFCNLMAAVNKKD